MPSKEADHVSWDGLLQRSWPREVERLDREARVRLTGKRVLVTGAGGWIGSALARAVAKTNTRELVLLDAAEGALHEVSQALNASGGAVPHTAVLASVCDSAAVDEIFGQYQPNIVYHAAAFKHVPLMEKHPFAVVANNTLGTCVLAEAAAKHGCERMVMVSTDKAADPASLMGASKRIAELVMLGTKAPSTRMQVVRLSNVLGSSGSVVPLFLRQIARGGPVTVSHSEVRRFFMTTEEAVATLLGTLQPVCPAGLLVPEPGASIHVLDLAKYLIGEKGTSIVFTELRPGDKMEEAMISAREAYSGEAVGLLRKVDTPLINGDELVAGIKALEEAVRRREVGLLLAAVLRLVPEYRPSLLLRERVSAVAGAAVNA